MSMQPVSSQLGSSLDGLTNRSVYSNSGNNAVFAARPVAAAVLITIPLCTQQAWAQNVASGQIVTSAIISTGGVQIVFSGGTAVYTSVFSRGLQNISSGGLAISGFIFSAGSQTIQGLASNTLVNGIGAAEVVAAFGTATGTVVSGGGVQSIESAGLSISATISSGGFQVVSGLASATVLSGGSQTIVSNGTAVSTTIVNRGTQFVAGGSANATTVTGSTLQAVLAGGVATSTTVGGGSSLSLQTVTAGTAISTTVSAFGQQLISAGGVASVAVISSGGQQSISSSGTAINTVLNGGVQAILSGGVASGTVVNSGSVEAIRASGTATGTVVNNVGTQFISAGGSSLSATIFGQGSQTVIGLASAAVLNGGIQLISSGGVAMDTVVNSGNVVVSAFGTAIGAVLSGARAEQSISSGGVASNTMISTSGLQVVSRGGVANNTTVNGFLANELVGFSGTATGTIVSNGSQTILAGGVAISATILSNGAQFVSGLASATVLNGGRQNVRSGGTALDTVISSDGVQSISAGGTAISTTISALGQQLASGETFATTIADGGSQFLAPGAVASGNVVSGMNALQLVSSSATALDNVVQAGGVQSDGGLASETTVLDGGKQIVVGGGSALSTTISSGGLQAIAAGGIATSTTVDGGAQQTITAGGIANLTTVNSGGAEIVSTGAVANNTVVNSGGGLTVASGGTANQAVIGAQVDAVNGATFTDTQIAAGGQLNTFAGALIGGITTIAGTLAIQDSNEQFDTLTLAGGTLQFGAANTPPASFISATVNTLNGNGLLSMRTDVASQTGDFLAVNNAQGSQQVLVHDYYDGKALDPAQRLLLISAASGPAVFSLVNGATDVGAYQYGLANQGGNWYLFNLGARTDTSYSVQAAAQAATSVWYGELQPLYRRLGELRLNPVGDGVWARTYGDTVHLTPANTVATDITHYGVEAGIDHRFATDSGVWYLGVLAGTGWVKQTFANNTGTGSATPWTIGTYATWLSNAGWYGDFVVKYNSINQKINTTAAGGQSVSASYRQNGYTLSAEGGRRFELAQRWFVEPQMELTTVHHGGASYTTSYDNTAINVDSGNALIGRVTIRVGRQFETQWQGSPLKLEPFGEISFIRQFQGESGVSVDGTNLESTARGNRAQLTLGVAAQSRSFQVYTALSYGRGQHYEQPWSFDIGLRKTW